MPSPLPFSDSSRPRSEPHLLRFRLRHLFSLVTVASLFCGVLVLTDGPWPMVIGVTALLVAAHVMANVVGTRLRDTSHEVRQWRASQPGAAADDPMVGVQPLAASKRELPPSTPLASRERVARWTLWFVLGGLAIGLCLGGTIIALTIGHRIEWAGWAVGTISCGVLGAWAAFLASTFSSIARHAWRHANERSK